MQGEEGMGKCSRCGTESDTRFCPNCGMSMEQDTSISGLVEQGDYPNKESAIPQKKKSSCIYAQNSRKHFIAGRSASMT